MTITAKIVLDSIDDINQKRLTTFELRYPRFIHSEFMTHRCFSRNASSSRAIPVKKMIQQVLDDPAMPIHWGRNQSGMQAHEELSLYDMLECREIWLEARDTAVQHVQRLLDRGLHKQAANRLLEPWMHITVLATATDLTNFFALRLHKDAQPEFQKLAREMAKAFLRSTPQVLGQNQWHLPYVGQDELDYSGIEYSLRFSVARCARVSYLNHDGTSPEPNKDLELHDRLVAQVPKHSSPAEHQAKPMQAKYYGNLFGWKPYRKYILAENITEFPWQTQQELLEELLAEIQGELV